VASFVTFFAFFSEDQICQTYVDFGFQQWRAYVLVFSVVLPFIALSVDFTMNRIRMSNKHLIITLILAVLYIFLSFLGSVA